MPTQQRLRELFDYRDGQLFNRTKRQNAPLGAPVGFFNETYYKCNVDGKRCSVHRLIWIWHYGPIPPNKVVDHVDRDRRNNRIENLRLVTSAGNSLNRTPFVPRRHDVSGLHWDSFGRRWRAVIRDEDGGSVYLGTSSDKHRLIWLVHLYRRGIYRPVIKLK